MNTFLIKLYTSIFFLILFSNLVAQKKALIIAVGDYPDAGLWPDISSANDVKHIGGALKTIGFKEEQINILKNSEATKSGILQAFAKLESSVEKDDFVVIHYSGHGQQVVDDNQDELDNLDEAIVPYDSPLLFEEGVYEGENLIRDEELGALTVGIRNKIGANGQLLLILDSCHSGSGTRGAGRARGTDKIMGPSDTTASPLKENGNMGIGIQLDESAAPMSCFFGASARELNYETVDDQGKPVGTLSYTLASVLGSLNNNPSHEDLFQRIKHKMKTLAPNQNPLWEGPQDLYLFSDESQQMEKLFVIENVNGHEAQAPIGTLNEVYEGTVVELISGQNEQVLCQGEVVVANLTNSMIEFDESLPNDPKEFLQIRIIEKTSPPFKCSIIHSVSEDSPWLEYIDEVFNTQLIEKGDGNADLFLSNEDDKLLLKTGDGRQLFSEKFSETRAKRKVYKLQKVIGKFAQGKYLKSFENPGSPLELQLEVLSVDCKDGKKEFSSVNDGQVKVGSCIKLKVTNQGTLPAYFSVIDIQPDNIVNLVIPATSLGYTSSEYFLKPGESYETNYTINIGEPYGHEILKLISSNEALDLPGILQSQGASRGVDNKAHSFEKFFANSFSESNTRGTSVERPSVEEVGTNSVYFEIVEQ